MKIAPLPENEEQRLTALKEYKIIDTPCEEIFDDITQLAATICDVPISLISLIDRNRQFIKSNYGLPIKETERDTSFCAHTILGVDIMEVGDAKKDDRFFDNPYVNSDPNIRFYAGSPLTTPEGLKIGALCLIDRIPKNLTPEQKNILNRLSKVIMTILELKKTVSQDLTERMKAHEEVRAANLQLEKGLEEQKKNNDTLTLFSKMNGMLQSCIDQNEAFAVIKSDCQKIFRGSSGSLYLISSSHEHVELMMEWNQPVSPLNYFETDQCWALRRGQYHVADSSLDILCNHTRTTEKNRMHICLPLNAQGEMFGLLCLNIPSSQEISDMRLLHAVRMAEQIALCLANIKLRQILRQQSTMDPLTGLYNRRYLTEFFRRKSGEATLSHHRLIAMLIDIDYFKKFNDTHGHDAGDLVLTTLANLLKKQMETDGHVFRLGGEEFLLLLEGDHLDNKKIKNRANAIRESVHEVTLSYNEKDLGKLTLSMGVAIYPTDASTLDGLLIAADKALYQAKENGRDQVIIHTCLSTDKK